MSRPIVRTAVVVAAVAVLAVLAADPAWAQCALCKAALESSPEGRAMGASLNRAILVMLAAPYLVLGTFALALFRRRVLEAGARAAAAVRASLARRLTLPLLGSLRPR
jgi:hypothetical protein